MSLLLFKTAPFKLCGNELPGRRAPLLGPKGPPTWLLCHFVSLLYSRIIVKEQAPGMDS